jgi:hypothetical protein
MVNNVLTAAALIDRTTALLFIMKGGVAAKALPKVAVRQNEAPQSPTWGAKSKASLVRR